MTWEAAAMGQKLSALGRSHAALLGGATLAMLGLQRGGVSDLAMTTAGEAMIGFRYGGPVEAAIGAGIGAVAGLVRLFLKAARLAGPKRQAVLSLEGLCLHAADTLSAPTVIAAGI